MGMIQCRLCNNFFQIYPQCRTAICPYCNNKIDLTAAFEQTQNSAQVFLQQQSEDTLITNGDFNTLFDVVVQVMMFNNVSIQISDKMSGVISGNALYETNFSGMVVECNFYRQNDLTMIKFNAYFNNAFDNSGVCRGKISEIVSGVMTQFHIIQSSAGISYMPKNSQYYARNAGGTSAMSTNGRVYNQIPGGQYSAAAQTNNNLYKQEMERREKVFIIGLVILLLLLFIGHCAGEMAEKMEKEDQQRRQASREENYGEMRMPEYYY